MHLGIRTSLPVIVRHTTLTEKEESYLFSSFLVSLCRLSAIQENNRAAFLLPKCTSLGTYRD